MSASNYKVIKLVALTTMMYLYHFLSCVIAAYYETVDHKMGQFNFWYKCNKHGYIDTKTIPLDIKTVTTIKFLRNIIF